ncbi:hypothetical protein [Streptomyces sp. SID9727]|uniref:hypothetical protein n=1 Tax=Streptomyces sp. SID9727 TaxID=2706114 RepID=UPI0013CA7266|nr:hypothetical protein [Streptomyces sp. SID9727]NEC68018.1 hypothetical protein [Streptomyces sp. SID9727]
MAHWTVARPAATPGGPARVGGAGWTAAWLTGAVALAGEGALTAVVYFLAGLRDEHYFATGIGAYVGYLVVIVVAAVVLGLAGSIGSAVVVLPVVQLSRWSARRAGRAEGTRWCVAVCGAVAATAAVGAGVPTLLLGGGWTVVPAVLAATFLGLAPAVLCTRAVTVVRRNGARFGLAALVLVCGASLSAVVFAGGLVAYGTGLIQAYEPPRLTAAQLVGTWSDEHGGTLTLRSDGTAAAHDMGARAKEEASDGGASERCDGTGTWTTGTSPSGTTELELSVSGCTEGPGWYFGGTGERPTLFYWIGDPDSLNQYALARQ